MALAQLAQQRRRLLVRRLAAGAEVPVDQHRAQRSVEADDRFAIIEGQRSDDIAVAPREPGGDRFGRAADGGFGAAERVVNHQHARVKRSCSGRKHYSSTR